MYSGLLDLPWWGYLLATPVLTHVTIAGVTICLHRHQAHRALELGPLPGHFFRLWLRLTTGMVTKEWAAIHRKHHAKCETAADPHSPQVLGLNRVLEKQGAARVKKVAPTPRLGAVRPAIDLDMLQAVVTHRYDVLARYLKTLRQLAAEGFAQLKIDAREGRTMNRLLGEDGAALPAPQKERLTALLARSERLARGYAMRAELEALWARSSASHDQLVAQLQDWVARAEQSGIRQLEEFSQRLRSYAI